MSFQSYLEDDHSTHRMVGNNVIGNMQAIRASYGGPEIINGCASGLAMLPRSASEAAVDEGNKFRQLPCRTFISVGTCPYRERCVYLHDPRIVCREAKTKTRRKNKDDVVLDSMFWPIMPYNVVAAKLDNNRQPHVIQNYVVPPPQNDQYRRHDECVFSIWMHFVDLCLAVTESGNIQNADAAPCYAAPDLPVNAYTKQPRLAVFRLLSGSRGRELTKEEIAGAELTGLGSHPSAEFGAKIILREITAGTFKVAQPAAANEGMIPRPEPITINSVNGKMMDGLNLVSPNAVNLRSPVILMHDPSHLRHNKVHHAQPASHLPMIEEYDVMSENSDSIEAHTDHRHNTNLTHFRSSWGQESHQSIETRQPIPRDPSQFFRMEGERRVTRAIPTASTSTIMINPNIFHDTKVTSSCFSPNSPTTLWMQHPEENHVENSHYGKEFHSSYPHHRNMMMSAEPPYQIPPMTLP